MKFYWYPKCSTCQRAKKFLESRNINYEERHILIETPDINELHKYIKKSNKDINKFFNTSGLKYRELNLKEKLKSLSYDEKLSLLTSDGMLIKRPLLILDNIVLIGFNEKEWSEFI